VRAKKHDTVKAMAAHSSCSVINGLTDRSHPCQALADLFTLREHAGKLRGAKLAWVGDGNNVARSLAMGCALLGVEFAIAAPEGYELDAPFLERLHAAAPDAELTATRDPAEAVRGASAVYTDVWASMGQEAEKEKRQRDFAGYQVDGKMMKLAGGGALFMHCLPAHRVEEVTDEVMDSPASIVVEQAANRMHVQKGILAWLLGTQS
jgi:ornithine carbamoyltransferase